MSENLHLEGDFTLNIPSYEANFTENEQPDIQADFSIGLDLEGSELIDITLINNTYKITSINYTHEQAIASDTWVINHNLNKRPSCTVVDTSGTVQAPNEITYNDNNTMTVEFLAPFTGYAYLN